MSCPRCGGKLILEDKVIFCGDCFFVVDRGRGQADFKLRQPKRKKGKWPKWRQLKVSLTKIAKEWTVGQRMTYKPVGIKATICVSKSGATYYNYYKHKHKL